MRRPRVLLLGPSNHCPQAQEPTNKVRNHAVTVGNNEVHPFRANLESSNCVKIEGNSDVGLEWFSTQSSNEHSVVLVGADCSCTRFSAAIEIMITQKIFLLGVHTNSPCSSIPQLEIRATNRTDVVLVTNAMDDKNALDNFGARKVVKINQVGLDFGNFLELRF